MSDEEKSVMLEWYWYLVGLSNDALAYVQWEEYEFYEEWRMAIKGGCLV